MIIHQMFALLLSLFISVSKLKLNFWHLADGHVHSYNACGCGETGEELPEASRCSIHRVCWQTSRESRTEGPAHVRRREEVR